MDGSYVETGCGLRKCSSAARGALGKQPRLSDGPHEFKFVIKQQAGELAVGFADAASGAAQKGACAAFGVWIDTTGEVQYCEFADAKTLRGDVQGELLRGKDICAVSEVRASLQSRRLHISFGDEAPLDLGVDMPAEVVPWAWIDAPGDEINFVEVPALPLQVFAHVAEGRISIVCASMGGHEVCKIRGLVPEDLGSVLAGRIRESAPAPPPDTRWKVLLPSGQILESDKLLFPLHELFVEVEQSKEEPGASSATPQRHAAVFAAKERESSRCCWRALLCT